MSTPQVLRQATLGGFDLFSSGDVWDEEIAIAKDGEILKVGSLSEFHSLWNVLDPKIQEVLKDSFPQLFAVSRV